MGPLVFCPMCSIKLRRGNLKKHQRNKGACYLERSEQEMASRGFVKLDGGWLQIAIDAGVPLHYAPSATNQGDTYPAVDTRRRGDTIGRHDAAPIYRNWAPWVCVSFLNRTMNRSKFALPRKRRVEMLAALTDDSELSDAFAALLRMNAVSQAFEFLFNELGYTHRNACM